MQTIFFFDRLVVVIFTVQKGLYNFGHSIFHNSRPTYFKKQMLHVFDTP